MEGKEARNKFALALHGGGGGTANRQMNALITTFTLIAYSLRKSSLKPNHHKSPLCASPPRSFFRINIIFNNIYIFYLIFI